jgi:hypothetical protein
MTEICNNPLYGKVNIIDKINEFISTSSYLIHKTILEYARNKLSVMSPGCIISTGKIDFYTDNDLKNTLKKFNHVEINDHDNKNDNYLSLMDICYLIEMEINKNERMSILDLPNLLRFYGTKDITMFYGMNNNTNDIDVIIMHDIYDINKNVNENRNENRNENENVNIIYHTKSQILKNVHKCRLKCDKKGNSRHEKYLHINYNICNRYVVFMVNTLFICGINVKQDKINSDNWGSSIFMYDRFNNLLEIFGGNYLNNIYYNLTTDNKTYLVLSNTIAYKIGKAIHNMLLNLGIVLDKFIHKQPIVIYPSFYNHDVDNKLTKVLRKKYNFISNKKDNLPILNMLVDFWDTWYISKKIICRNEIYSILGNNNEIANENENENDIEIIKKTYEKLTDESLINSDFIEIYIPKIIDYIKEMITEEKLMGESKFHEELNLRQIIFLLIYHLLGYL